ncbi:cupin domain-containing protein [Nucisporomicrobium flavum]|uniref:cupin domain-containing protein n=1 Tax=Nucisporomicrobium flavum TaxID=2785915 RepID=UPI0018F63A4E|nr:hypothetical protein [Nucisporomicrobium flavum]
MNLMTTDRHATLEPLLTLDPNDIGQLPWCPVPDCPGVVAKELWAAGDLNDTLISYGKGCATPGRPHLAAHQHIWVISGSASIAARTLVAGSYVYVPPGTTHSITAGAGGCLLLQMHLPLS